MGRSKQKKQESEEQQEDDQQSIPQEEQDQNLQAPDEEEQVDQFQLDHRRQLDLLYIIQAQIKEAADAEKLTWLAFYSLKQKEIDLQQKMFDEISALKDKYQLLKQHLFSKLASAAVGKKVDNQLYKPQGISVTVDPSKVTPAPLSQYWVTVFDKSGLVQDQKDFQALRKLEDFWCEMLDLKTNHLRITFKFKQETALFSNKQLTLQVMTEQNAQKSPKIILKQPIKFKGKKADQSIFNELFSQSVEPNETFKLANEFYRDYCNSIYFYMRKDDIDIIDVDQSQQKSAKSAKKGNGNKPEKKELQKPDCKQQ